MIKTFWESKQSFFFFFFPYWKEVCNKNYIKQENPSFDALADPQVYLYMLLY